MANGPLGGFMPTPPSPGQPPQVSLNTNAESRGKFNNFLGTLPKNGATTPIQTGVGLSSPMPVSPIAGNVNIFQPQMSQIAPMPMMPPAQPVRMMFNGGQVDDFGDFSSVGDDAPSVDTGFSQDSDENNFDVGFTEEEDPSRTDYQVDDSGIFTGTGGDDSPAPIIDTRPRTNIRNVGARSNLRYDPQFTANQLQRRGLDPQGFMAPSDFQQTTQGGGSVAAPTLSSGLPSLSLGQNLLGAKPTISRQDVLTAQNRLADITPASAIPLAPTSPFFDRDLLDDPLGLGVRTGFGPVADAARRREALTGAFGPERGIQVSRLPTVVPGAEGTLPDADPLATDVIKAIRSGPAGLPFTNNPGALKQGQEDLTTEVVKSLPASGSITPDNLAPAIFNTLDSGIDAIDRQLSLYSRNNINTPEALANTYLGSGDKENSPENRAGYIDAIKSVAGESFNLGNPATRDAIKNVIVNQEFGQAGRDVMAEMRRGTDASVLDGLNLNQLALNQPLTSDVNQLGSLDPIGQTTQTTLSPPPAGFEENVGVPGALRQGDRIVSPDSGLNFQYTTRGTTPKEQAELRELRQIDDDEFNPRVLEASARGSRLGEALANDFLNANRMPGTAVSDFLNLATRTQNISPENTAARIARNNRTINEIRADLGSRVPDTALETLQDRRDRSVQGPPRMPDTVLDIDTTFDPITLDDRLTTVSPDVLSSIGREQRIDDANTFRSTVPDAAKIFGGRQIQTTPLDQGVDSIVGDDVEPSLETRDIVGDVTQERVADILNRPEAFKSTFKIGDVEFPNLLATLANKAGSFFDRRLFDGIVDKGLDAVVDPDTGRIIGAKDEFGNLIEGRDLEQFQQDDGGSDPITRFLRRATEQKEEEKEDKPPNVIGSTTTTATDPAPKTPTVVESKFPASTASFSPVGFDTGSLNDLIARITGVPSPRRMQDGGVISSVDNFLTKVA